MGRDCGITQRSGRGLAALAALIAIAALVQQACADPQRVEATPAAPPPIGQGPAAGAVDTSWPSEAVPAFRPGGEPCAPPYVSAGSVCVHAAFRARASESELESEREAYSSGASSPMVGGPASMAGGAAAHEQGGSPSADPAQPSAAPDRARLDPGALTERPPPVAPSSTSLAAKESRLRGLQMMLDALAARDGIKRPAAIEPPPEPQPVASPTQRTPAPQAGAASSPGGAPSDVGPADLARVQAVLDLLTPGERRTALENLEGSGARQALGEDAWQQLTGGEAAQADGLQ